MTQDDSVRTRMTKFNRDPELGYTLITPDTPLEVLEEFLEKNLFALGTSLSGNQGTGLTSTLPQLLIILGNSCWPWQQRMILILSSSGGVGPLIRFRPCRMLDICM